MSDVGQVKIDTFTSRIREAVISVCEGSRRLNDRRGVVEESLFGPQPSSPTNEAPCNVSNPNMEDALRADLNEALKYIEDTITFLSKI